MDDLYKHIGGKIRELRENYAGKKLSQEEMALAVKTTANTISRWETGTYKISTEDLHKLANFFGVAISIFFPGMENTKLQALLSATGDLRDEDLEALTEYAQFRKARRKLQQARKKKMK
jgi:transcriptional regulator with XRE-family HTH domain